MSKTAADHSDSRPRRSLSPPQNQNPRNDPFPVPLVFRDINTTQWEDFRETFLFLCCSAALPNCSAAAVTVNRIRHGLHKHLPWQQCTGRQAKAGRGAVNGGKKTSSSVRRLSVGRHCSLLIAHCSLPLTAPEASRGSSVAGRGTDQHLAFSLILSCVTGCSGSVELERSTIFI